MKKILQLLFVLFLTISQTVQAYDNNIKKQLDSLALSALQAAEQHNETKMTSIIEKMIDIGATGGSDPTILKKRTPQCPPVKISLNGKQLSGSLCAKMGYEYDGKVYWVGYCKP